MSSSVTALACVLFAVVATGCVVEAEPARPPPPACPADWVRGWRDQAGYWHPGHWQCRGAREVIIVR